ncbi:MAG: PAS domain-containing protein, partial [Lachnospiraceae bacterium]|nr:PAS domain-containing protein [Lachnospiraceae bacterium]
MYHCHIHFYLTGHYNRSFEIIREMSPLAHFTHTFSESDNPEKALAAEADVIFAYLHDMHVQETLQTLLSCKNETAEIILLADKEQVALLTDFLPEIKDIWITPMSEDEIRFRFLRWQQTCKMSKDFWETSHYFDATINHIPNLIWYKDKNGIHEKVNDSFCKTVNKTKEQVEGRGHAYIWDVEHD